MATAMRGAWLGLVALALSIPHPVSADSIPVYQSGTIIPGHAVKFFAPGLIGDAGGTLVTPTLAAIATSGSASDLIAGTVPSARLAAIPNTSLANSSLTIAGHLVSLGGSATVACADLSNGATGCSTATGTFGATIPLLNGINTWSGAQSFNSGDLVLKGATSGTLTINAASVAGTNTITFPAGSTNFAGTGGTSQVVKQSTAGGGFTVARVNCADLTDGSVYCPATLGQLPGTTTNDSASAGNIGQVVTSAVTSGSAVPLTTSTLTDITTISVPAGDWDIRGNVYFNAGATTTITAVVGYINTTSATDPGTTGPSAQLFATMTSGKNQRLPLPAHSYKFASPTTVYLIGYSEFGTATMGGYGWIEARRVR